MASIHSQLSRIFPGESTVQDSYSYGSFLVKESNQRIFTKFGQGGDGSLRYEYEGLKHIRACASAYELYIPKPLLFGTDETDRGKGKNK